MVMILLLICENGKLMDNQEQKSTESKSEEIVELTKEYNFTFDWKYCSIVIIIIIIR